MGLAGWHLSRNKVLLFSGVLLVMLFASRTSFVSTFPTILSSSASPVLYERKDRDVCISVIHHVVFEFELKNKDRPLNDSSVCEDLSWHWDKFGLLLGCDFQKLGKEDAFDLLKGSWVVVAGDSQARLFVVSLLGLVLGPEKMELVQGDLFKRHSNYQTVINSIGLRLDFLWAPYARNLTNIIMEFVRHKSYPDVLVIGAGLWDMLRITNSTEYRSSLQQINAYLVALLPVSQEFSGSD